MDYFGGLKVKIFVDGASLKTMREFSGHRTVKGFTTNPTLMKQAGVTDYESFAKEALSAVSGRPISFEVLSDDFGEMEKEARKIAGWGKNVYVKVPVTNTEGKSSEGLIRKASHEGISLNVTAVMTLKQVEEVCGALNPEVRSIVSVFAGRIADTGRDPVPIMKEAASIVGETPNAELLWASPRELLNVLQAELCNCHIITITDAILKKADMLGMDLSSLSLDTVRMFYKDAVTAGLKL
ncbi:MAG: transaldolase [Deltaproteobacteria bacterium]|nr:transaldolase [Deltaproteobacteria bacterium]